MEVPSISVTITGHARVIRRVLEVVAGMEAEEAFLNEPEPAKVEVKPVAVEAKSEAPVEAKSEAEIGATLEDVKAALVAFGKRKGDAGNQLVASILEEVGAKKISMIAPEKYDEVLKLIASHG